MSVINSRAKDITLARAIRRASKGQLSASSLRVKTEDGRYVNVSKVIDRGNGVYDIVPSR